ncbi:P-loop containing nucleoside triphosphate hydrolase protein [Cladorrhinum sp. PSN332]|nr:P-loop containing nucleoside triphosphate hydrolase protein [Cladorrhinum sp. PSN332]
MFSTSTHANLASRGFFLNSKMVFAYILGQKRPSKLPTGLRILLNFPRLDTAGPSKYLSKASRTRLSFPRSYRCFSQSSSSNSQNEAHLAIEKQLLQEKFGYSSFRHEQEGAIEALLRDKNALVVFPTGAGKSLCYQIPAIAFPELDKADGSRLPQEAGITIVVSPLNSLIKDQVDTLKRKGIAAENIDSTRSAQEIRQIYASMAKSELQLVYCGPERLASQEFFDSLSRVPGGIRLVAVDEAHCVSEWGHSFRPDYLKVARFVDEIKADRVICLTATATPRVAEDICHNFKINPSNVFKTSPYRSNLELHAKRIIYRSASSYENIDDLDPDELFADYMDRSTYNVVRTNRARKLKELCQFLDTHPGPTIIFVALRRKAEKLAELLKAMSYNAEAYHAGLGTSLKQQTQDNFMASKNQIICSTIAFGMGIDKPDIRNVVHWELASTVEEYSQQIGRAGRDGKKSHCMFFLSPDSFYWREMFSRWNTPSRHSVQNLISDIFSSAQNVRIGGIYKSNQFRQANRYDIRPVSLSIIYAMLEMKYGLFRATNPEYTSFKFTFTPLTGYGLDLKMDPSLEARAILTGTHKHKKWLRIDAAAMAEVHDVEMWDIVQKLLSLHYNGSIRLRTNNVRERYILLKEIPGDTMDPDKNKVADEIYAYFLGQEKKALGQNRDVIDLVTGGKCFALALAEHFGMGLPDGKTKCGHCTHCLTGERVQEPPREIAETTPDSIKEVLAATDIRDDPRFLARLGFGILTPRMGAEGLADHRVFGSLRDHSFEVSNKLADVAATILRGGGF